MAKESEVKWFCLHNLAVMNYIEMKEYNSKKRVERDAVEEQLVREAIQNHEVKVEEDRIQDVKIQESLKEINKGKGNFD